MRNFDIKRGDIYYVYRFPVQIGSEVVSGRPAIVVSNDSCNRNSDVVEVVYLTTQPKKEMPTHVLITSSKRPSIAMCEQITAIDVSRFGDYIGKCTPNEMKEIDDALKISLGVD